MLANRKVYSRNRLQGRKSHNLKDLIQAVTQLQWELQSMNATKSSQKVARLSLAMLLAENHSMSQKKRI